MKKLLKLKIIFFIVFCMLFLLCILFYFKNTKVNYGVVKPYNVLTYTNSKGENSNESLSKGNGESSNIDTLDNSSDENQVIYLSDIPYSKAQVAWGNISLDKTQDNAAFTMLLNGSTTVIKKGIWAHATSTVEYDISNYKDYAYFTTFYGLNSTSGNKGNGVKFYIYTSVDGKEWTLRTEENPTAIKSSNNAVSVKIDIRDANYIRLYAHDNGSNASDHAVWGDAKLIKEGYNDNVMITVEELDEIIKEAYRPGAIQDDLRLPLLQRDFIRRVGQYQLRNFLEEDPTHQETLEWFLNNEEALRLWTIGGKPSGTYLRSLEVLSKLYSTYKEDLNNEELTPNGTKYKDLYLKMMLSLSLTHAANVGLWVGGNQLSDAVTRYDIYKQMHLNGDLASNAMFESYTIDEMRGVMFVNIDDEEMMWLHDYSEKKFSNIVDRFNPFKYINYTTGYSYYRPQYYTQENYDKWDQKYELSKYNITYQSGKPKLWIVFEEGSVCGGLSKTAANLYGVWGTPAYVVGQPAHAAYIYLKDVGGGKYVWQLSYNVASTAWAATDGRALNGWGSRYSSGVIKTGSYRLLAQDAQNEYEKYEQAQLILLLEDVYKDDRDKLKQIYLDALKEERINLDAWIGLINLYITDDTKTDSDMIELATEIAEVYAYHPLPMYDLTKRIGSKITSPEYKSKMLMLQEQTLRKAAKATSANTLYYKEVPVIANAILGVVDSSIGNFSFDGANAGKIILSRQLQSAQVTWSYSLDGGNTWKECYDHSVQLTNEEIASINVNDDIKIHISGLPMTDANIYTINITKRTFPSGVVSINDEENRILNATSDMEWTLDPNGEWNSFANTNPVFNGNKKVYVRVIATGTQVASDPVYFTFKENNSDDTKWYIQSKNLQVIEVNATGAGNFNNVLDGNINTYWRSKAGMFPAYITIKLDEPRYISGLDYVPDKSAVNIVKVPYGIAKKVNIYVSMDGTNWELAASKDNLGNNVSLKHIDLPEPKKASYVKFECESIYPPMDSATKYKVFTASVIKLYENVIVNETPRAEVNYNITTPTNKDVIAELINPIRPITVTNNDGKMTHTFKENGEFTFEFVDEDGNSGSTTARVDWIDKTLPQVDVNFSTTEPTNEDVVATLTFSKPNITILSTDVQIAENPVDKSKTITFEDNASYELKFSDELGNIGTKTITVDWIDKEAPTAELTYSTVNLTDKPVTVTMEPSEEVTVLNNGGSTTYTFEENGTFTFEFVDRVGNTGSVTASVNWISKIPEYTLTYSTTEPTNQNVIVTLDIEEGYRIVSNNGINTYIFTENGESHFEYVDPNGNRGIIPISVNWIDKDAPIGTIMYSTETATINPVIATITFDKENVTITNNEGANTYTFTENGDFTFEFIDALGNVGMTKAEVTWIKEELPPVATITYNTTELTNQDVTATITFDKENVAITNNDGASTYTFTENGDFIFEYIDGVGNRGSVVAKVDWIDKVKPEATLSYDITEKTELSVTATVSFDKENVTITNNGGLNTYTFTENGEFTFEFVDKAGNINSITANVTWIEKKQPEENPDKKDQIKSNQYEIKNNIIRKVPLNLEVREFMKNITATKEVIIKDKNGKVITGEAKIGTGMKAYVGSETYTFVVKSDIDGNGKLSLTDFAKMCLHYIGKVTLTKEYFEAADMDNNNKITITDLAKIQLLLTGKNK